MCSRRVGAALALLLTGLPSGLVSQSAGVWRDSTLLLSREIRTLRDSLLQGDSTVSEVARSGNLAIGASAPWREAAARALPEFDRVRRRWFGDALPSPDGFRIVLRSERYYGRWSSQTEREIGLLVLAGGPDTGQAVRTQRNAARDELDAALLDLYGELMYASAGPRVQAWLELTPPLSLDERQRRYVAMYAVVTGTGRAQRGCVAGWLADCAYVLALRPPAGAEPGGTLAPFVRTDLMLTALELGGAGAWERFREGARGSIGDALAAAAAMPLDSLLARWQRGILALRPTGGPVRPAAAVLLLGWSVAVLGGVLAMARRP